MIVKVPQFTLLGHMLAEMITEINFVIVMDCRQNLILTVWPVVGYFLQESDN